MDADGSPMGRPQDDEQLTQRAAAEAVRLSAKALRMTLQKIGGDPVTRTGNVVGSFETIFLGGSVIKIVSNSSLSLLNVVVHTSALLLLRGCTVLYSHGMRSSGIESFGTCHQ